MTLSVPCYSFDHSRPVVAHGNFGYTLEFGDSMVDRSVVQKKFDLWDDVVRRGLLRSSDDLVRARAISLLKDKTILAYSQLRYDDSAVRMLYLQDAVLSDSHDRVLFCGCNQHIGKSFTLNVDAATSFLLDHGKNWIGILVSGSLGQSQFQMDRIKQLLKSSNITYREEDTIDSKTGKKDNATMISYTFYGSDGKTPLYRNLLICCPHTSSALGYPVDDMWLDEFDFWENCDQEHFMNQIAIPRTFRTRGRIKIYTNPDGKEKMMFKLWNQKTSDGSPAWHRYQFNYWDKPGASQEEFDKLIIGMEKHRIESTLLAVFTKTEGSFFSTEEIEDLLSDTDLVQKGEQAGYGRDTAWFLDVGSVHDQSVLIGAYLEENPEVPGIPIVKVFFIHKYPVGYPLSRVIGVERQVVDDSGGEHLEFVTSPLDPDDGWEDYAEENPSVRLILEEYSQDFNGKKLQPLFGYDATGNAGLNPLISVAGIDAIDITFSGKLKWHMYQRYQYYVQQRFLKRAKERDLNTVRGCDFDYQARKLVVKKGTRTTYKQIHHENEEDLDDTQDAIAGVIHLIENPDLPSLSFDIFDTRSGKSVVGSDGRVRDDVPANIPPDQYIPSFVDKSELSGWIEQKERVLR